MIAEMKPFAVFIGEIRENARKTDTSDSEILFASDFDRSGSRLWSPRLSPAPPGPPEYNVEQKARGAFELHSFVPSTLYSGARGDSVCFGFGSFPADFGNFLLNARFSWKSRSRRGRLG